MSCVVEQTTTLFHLAHFETGMSTEDDTERLENHTTINDPYLKPMSMVYL